MEKQLYKYLLNPWLSDHICGTWDFFLHNYFIYIMYTYCFKWDDLTKTDQTVEAGLSASLAAAVVEDASLFLVFPPTPGHFF